MKVSTVVKKMVIIMLVAAAVFIFIAVLISFFHPIIEPLPFSIGVLLSTLLNIVKVVWLEQAVEKAADMEDEKAAGNYIRAQYLLRFVLTAVVLVAAALISQGHNVVWGAVVGLFTFHPAKYSLGAIAKAEYDDKG